MTLVDRVVPLVLAGLLVHVPLAHAQSAGAEALFREGRALIKQGKLREGCDKLDASEKLESSVGTLLNLGDCLDKLDKPASAWAAFRKAEALAKRNGNDKKRQREAKRRAEKLEPDLAHVTVQVGPKSRSGGLVVKRDGEVVDPVLYGDAIVVDPGSYTIVAEAPGYKPWQQEVSVGKGGKRFVVVPSLEKLPEPPAPPPVAEAPEPEPTAVAGRVTPLPRTVTVQDTWSTTRGIAVGVAIAGAGALGAGIYFGSRANDLEDRSNAICPLTICDDARGLALNDDAQDHAFRANVLFAAGGAAVAAATVMWLVGSPDEKIVIVPAVGDSHAGASLAGRF